MTLTQCHVDNMTIIAIQYNSLCTNCQFLKTGLVDHQWGRRIYHKFFTLIWLHNMCICAKVSQLLQKALKFYSCQQQFVISNFLHSHHLVTKTCLDPRELNMWYITGSVSRMLVAPPTGCNCDTNLTQICDTNLTQ